MKVHFIHLSAKPGGIEVLLPLIIKSLPRILFSAFVVRPLPEKAPNVYRETGIPLRYGSDSNLKAWLRLWIYARKYKQEIFHTYNLGPIFLLTLKLAGVRKIIYAIHGTKYWENKRQMVIRKVMWKMAHIQNMRIMSNSEYSKNCFLKSIGYNEEIQVVYNPIDLDRFTCLDKPRVGLRIIYTGRLSKGKNLKKWLIIASKILLEYPEAEFVIYGDGVTKSELINLTKKLGIANKVLFRGFQKDIEMAYKNADLLLFLSEYESFGNVVVESILCGTPVIASSIPSLNEIFRNFPDFLVDMDDTLENNILNKIKDIDNLRILVPKVIEEFKERFSTDQHVKKLVNIYSSFDH